MAAYRETPDRGAGRRVAVVTGAGSGIGRAAALALAEAGFAVVGTSRRAAAANPLEGVTFLDLDVTSDESARSLIGEVIDRFGRVDVLVNNAGVGLAGAAEEASIGQAQAVLDANVIGTVRMTNAVLPHMRAAGTGRIINVSSVLGFIPAPFMAIYAASKHAVEGYSESLDHELRTLGIRVLTVEPGYTRTAFETNTIWGDSPIAVYDESRRVAGDVLSAAMRTADSPETVAGVIVTAVTAARPKVRYQAGRTAAAARLLHRLAPAGVFDAQIRKLNRLPR
jgi:NAD(P)-dependent dehydrogenase (short-subunit alcohol dehydrogenase family)